MNVDSDDIVQDVSPIVVQYRRYWLPELLIVLFVLGCGTWLCLVYPVDLMVSAWFYKTAGSVQVWPYAAFKPWMLLNKSDTLLTVILGGGALLVLLLGIFQYRWRVRRVYALFVLVSLIIGPGLIVNGVFKDHWGRPRPRQIKEFGGKMDYRPPLLKGVSGHGRSFPSGHASVAFEYMVFWFVWRRKRRWAVPALLGGFALGSLMSVARFSVGAHFFSDVLWSWGLSFLVSLILYYFVFRIPQWEDAKLDR